MHSRLLLTLIIILLLLSMPAVVQQYELVNPQKDKQLFEDYTIWMLPDLGPNYGEKLL
jgi:hypothetical protein